LATGGRELLITAGTLGAGTLFRATGEIGYGVVSTAGELYSTYQNASAVSDGIDNLAEGKSIGLLQVGLGALGLRGNVAAFDELATGFSQVAAYNKIAKVIENGDFSTPVNGAVLWSGGQNMAAAQQWAAANGKFTAEMTPTGQWLNNLKLFGSDSPVAIPQAAALWDMASTKFVNGASGKVNAFTVGTNMVDDAQRTFYRLEMPLLRANANWNRTITYRGY
jgi:hypothetical protein